MWNSLAMVKTLSHRDVPAKDWVLSQVCPHVVFVVGKLALRQVFLEYFHCPFSVSVHRRCAFIHLILVVDCVVKQYAVHLLSAMPSCLDDLVRGRISCI